MHLQYKVAIRIYRCKHAEQGYFFRRKVGLDWALYGQSTVRLPICISTVNNKDSPWSMSGGRPPMNTLRSDCAGEKEEEPLLLLQAPLLLLLRALCWGLGVREPLEPDARLQGGKGERVKWCPRRNTV